MPSYKNPNAEIDFITSNPATDAYVAGQKASREAETAELTNAGKIVENAVNLQSAPTRLRKLNAETSSAESGADVAYRTRDSQVSTSKANASLAGTNASVAAQTAPYKVSEAASGAAKSGAEAQVATATVPDKIEGSKIGLRQQRATTLNTEMTGFYKSLELANAGDIEGAKSVAAATGQTIPDVVFQNADVRTAITRAAKRAQEIYPDRPKDQQTFIHGFLTDIATRGAQGQPASAPAAPYQVPGAPEPQESTGSSSYELVPARRRNPTTGEIEEGYIHHDKRSGEKEFVAGETLLGKGGAGGKTSVFQQKQSAWLEVHPGDTQGALAYASGHRQMTEYDIQKSSLAMAGREIAGNMQTKFATPAAQNAAITARAAEMAVVLRSAAATSVGGTRPAPGAPAPAAPAAAAGAPPGAGTSDAPYQASTQAHVDWFKKSAPAGAVIIINGKPFTK